MANKLILELRETPVALGGREFMLREMSGAKQNKFYPLIANFSKVMTSVQDLEKRLLKQELSEEENKHLEHGRAQIKTMNEEIWTMILNPADDNRDRITSEWLDNFANDRLGEAILHEQFSLNNFESTMGKLTAQAQTQAVALGAEPAELQLGSITAVPLADSITSTLSTLSGVSGAPDNS